MRSITTFCVLLVASMAWAGKDEYKKAAEDCMKELDIKKNDKGLPDKDDFKKKCFFKCFGLKLGLIDEKGVLDESKFPEEMKATAKECDKEATDTDLCKRANVLGHCLFSKMKKKE